MHNIKNNGSTYDELYSKMKKRAAILAESINRAKDRGVSIMPHESIEGKKLDLEDE